MATIRFRYPVAQMLYKMKDYIPILFLILFGINCHSTHQSKSNNSKLLFNAVDLDGWINVNQAPDNWLAREGNLVCQGKVPGYLSSEKNYTEFTLEFDYLAVADSGAFVFFHNDLLPAVGSPFPQGESFPLKTNSNRNNWQHYNIRHTASAISVSINGQPYTNFVLSGGSVKKHISFASYKSTFSLKNIHLTTVPASAGQKVETDTDSFLFHALYSNTDLQQWQMKPGHDGHWTAQDWYINYDGKSTEKDKCLWSKKTFRDFILVADVRLTRKPEPALSPVVLPNGETVLNNDGSNKQAEVPYAGDTGIYLRGDSKNQVNIGNRYIGSGEIYGYRVDKMLSPAVRKAVTPAKKADKAPGEWNRFIITLKGDRVTVVLNDETVISHAQLPGIAAEGAIALQDDHANNNQFQFANIYIREL